MLSAGDVEAFRSHCADGDVAALRRLLEVVPLVTDTESALVWGDDPPLQCATRGGHGEVVRLLLGVSDIDVNRTDTCGCTALHEACIYGRLEVLKVLLCDFRVDVNHRDRKGRTPLFYAGYYTQAEVVKWLIVSGREIEWDLEGRAMDNGKEYTSHQIAGRYAADDDGKTLGVLSLFLLGSHHHCYRHHIRLQLCLETGALGMMAAEIFALVVLFCDGFLTLRSPRNSASRFFRVCESLPMELQKILCYRALPSPGERILSADTEFALKTVLRLPDRDGCEE